MAANFEALPQTCDAARLGLLMNLGGGDAERARLAVNTRISRGLPVPPWVALPNVKRRIWLTATVLQWLKQHEGHEISVVTEPSPQTCGAPVIRRVGRPTKAAQVAARLCVSSDQ